MSIRTSRPPLRLVGAATALAVLLPVAGATAAGEPATTPRLTGRAVLPAETYAPGPPSGAALAPSQNGVTFPTPSQPVAGFSGIVDGRRPGEYLVIADNGFGGRSNSTDFLIRAYYLTPQFKTATGGSGGVEVGAFVQFSDPWEMIGFPIVREGTPERWLTGGDIDPESIQRDRLGHLWVGDEFGPWVLHFDAEGRLLEAPIALPDGLISPNNPHLGGTPTVANSRGVEAMAITPDQHHLVVVLEGAVPGDDPLSRRVYRYSMDTGRWQRRADYVVESASPFVADVQAVSGSRLITIERDGIDAAVRGVYEFDLRPEGSDIGKRRVVDLAAIPDPDLVSLPPINAGDVGLGDPFRVACESIEALHVVSSTELLLGCDNNFPNSGRNPTLPDDNELIVVAVERS